MRDRSGSRPAALRRGHARRSRVRRGPGGRRAAPADLPQGQALRVLPGHDRHRGPGRAQATTNADLVPRDESSSIRSARQVADGHRRRARPAPLGRLRPDRRAGRLEPAPRLSTGSSTSVEMQPDAGSGDVPEILEDVRHHRGAAPVRARRPSDGPVEGETGSTCDLSRTKKVADFAGPSPSEPGWTRPASGPTRPSTP